MSESKTTDTELIAWLSTAFNDRSPVRDQKFWDHINSIRDRLASLTPKPGDKMPEINLLGRFARWAMVQTSEHIEAIMAPTYEPCVSVFNEEVTPQVDAESLMPKKERPKSLAIKEGTNWSIDELAVAMQTCFTSYKLEDGSYGFYFDINQCKKILHDLVEPKEKKNG